MKLASFFAVTIGAAAGWKDMGDSGALLRSVDASPEALIIGGSLLMIAAVLRQVVASETK
jgi:hypothetical protein